ncbi:MAG: hypothetical protein ACREQV_00890, partial [Candidatus Binatia bacterium]
FHRQGYREVLDADIQGFFDNIPHRIIMEAVAAEVADGNILRLLRLRWIMEKNSFNVCEQQNRKSGADCDRDGRC